MADELDSSLDFSAIISSSTSVNLLCCYKLQVTVVSLLAAAIPLVFLPAAGA
jgi:hypothetical protein